MLLASIVPIQGYLVVKPTPTSPDNNNMMALSTAAPTETPHRILIKRNNVQKTLSYIQDQAEACNNDDGPIDKNVDEKIRQLWQTVTVYCGNNQVKTVTKTKTATATATETVSSDDDDDDDEYECDEQCWSDYLWRKCYCQ